MANYDAIFAGPEEGYVPTAHEQMTGRANADDAATAMGGGAAMAALRAAFDHRRLQQVQTDINREDDLLGGRPQRIAGLEQVATAGLEDFASEAAAGREFLPNAAALHSRNVGDALSRADVQYGAPARARAAGDIDAASIAAEGRVRAASAGRPDQAVTGLQNALRAMIESNGGKLPSPAEVEELRRIYRQPGRDQHLPPQ